MLVNREKGNIFVNTVESHDILIIRIVTGSVHENVQIRLDGMRPGACVKNIK